MMNSVGGFRFSASGVRTVQRQASERLATRLEVERYLEHLETLRDELVMQFPEGKYPYYRSTDVGILNQTWDRRIGIVVYHSSPFERDTVVRHLTANDVIQPELDGMYRYKEELVHFAVVDPLLQY